MAQSNENNKKYDHWNRHGCHFVGFFCLPGPPDVDGLERQRTECTVDRSDFQTVEN